MFWHDALTIPVLHCKTYHNVASKTQGRPVCKQAYILDNMHAYGVTDHDEDISLRILP